MLHAMGSAGPEAVKRLESIIGHGRTRSELERALFLARGDENRALDILFQVQLLLRLKRVRRILSIIVR